MRGVLPLLGQDNRLGRRLVLYMVLSSALLSGVAAGFQLYFSYDRDRGVALQTFETVESSFTLGLEKAVWEFNFSQVNALLDGIAAKSAVVGVTLTAETGQVWHRGTQPAGSSALSRTFTLSHAGGGGERRPGGALRIDLTMAGVHDRLWSQFQTIFLSNMAKTTLASIVMLVLFHSLVARHLRHMARYVAQTDWLRSRKPLTLRRKRGNGSDDLEDVVRAVNEARVSVLKSIDTLNVEIHDRQIAEREATRGSAAKSAFLATMSHEVRTPINAIMGLLELIGRAKIPERQRKQAQAAHSSAEALLTQLTNVLEVSKLEAHSIELRFETVSLHDLADALRGQLEGAIAHAHKPLSSDVTAPADAHSVVTIDIRRTLQITANLIDNATRFTDAGSIKLSVRHDTETLPAVLHITVEDTGIGIADDHLERIFDRFAQVDDPLTRSTGGSGLGLAISRGLAELMDGSLTVKSCIGHGSTFTLNIPTKNRFEARDGNVRARG
ncbi:MAG: ATP-binding protein [Paracoccaceae bacterium]